LGIEAVCRLEDGRWKKEEWRKHATGVSLLPPEKRPRTKDDDEDEED
jgi:hypothetical protein